MNLPKTIGNLLLITSISSTLYIYYPIISQEINFHFNQTSQIAAPKSSDFGIVIDKLGINETVTKNVNPFDQADYMPVLQNSIAHANGSSLPDQNGNIYLFAHSSDDPFSITRYNTSFYLLPKLNPGDEIKIFYQGEEKLYHVRETKTVKPWQAKSIITNETNQLTLQTCTPIGTSINRFLVFADPV